MKLLAMAYRSWCGLGLFVLLLWAVASPLQALPGAAGGIEQVFERDSIGTEVRNGITYIIYQVEQGETLFGIARKYNLKTDEVIKHNQWAEKGLSIGDNEFEHLHSIKMDKESKKSEDTKKSNSVSFSSKLRILINIYRISR